MQGEKPGEEEPETPFEEGPHQTIAWYQTHGDWLDAIIARRDAFLEQALTLGDRR